MEIPTVGSRHPTPRAGRKDWILLALLVAGYMVYTLDRMVIGIIIEPLKKEFGLTDSDVGLLASFGSTVPFVLFCIPLGRAADRLNRKWLLVGLIAIWSIFTGFAGFATSLAMFYVSRIGVASAESGFTPIGMSLISDSFPRSKRSTALSLFTAGGFTGTFLAMALGGAIVGSHGWRAAFLVAGLPGLLLCLVIILVVREPERGRFDGQVEEERAPLGAVVARIIADRRLFLSIAALVFGSVMSGVNAVWTPSLFVRVFGLSVSEAGYFSAVIIGLASMTGAAFGGAFADRIGAVHEGRKTLVPLAGCALSVTAGLIGYTTPSMGVALCFLSLMAFFGQSFNGPAFAMIMTRVPATMRATVASILLLVINVGSFSTGTFLVGVISDRIASIGSRSLAVGMACMLVGPLIGALCYLALYRQQRTGRVNEMLLPDANVSD